MCTSIKTNTVTVLKMGLVFIFWKEDEQMADKILTPLKAIRAKCMDCCCGQAKEIKLCNMKNCPLYPYRMGKRPKVDKDIDEGVKCTHEIGHS